MPALTQPLTDDEIEHLDDFLYGLNQGKAMTLEEMDGFFCALICGSELVPPSEYLPHVWGANWCRAVVSRPSRKRSTS